MSYDKKNFLTLIFSIFLSIFVLYFYLFTKTYLVDHAKNPNLFQSIKTLEFYKKYINTIHHLRETDGKWEIDNNPANYLFSTINEFSSDRKNILIQGDSWIAQLNEIDESYIAINKFAKKNSFGLINAGIASYSPSLMQLQYEVLEKDFNIKPSIVVAYIDQTDIGDEICRYKNKRVYDKNNILVAVKKENHSRAANDYTKIINISDIILHNQSKLKRTFKLTNFFISYGFFRAIEKFKSIKEYGWKNRDISKCRFNQIMKYMIKSDINEISYFENRLKDYINFLSGKKYIKNIILVSFPHKGHIFGYKNLENENSYYTFNVSDVIENLIKNNEKIYHLNFSQLVFDREINLKKDFFKEHDPASNLKDKYHFNIFAKKIINLLE